MKSVAIAVQALFLVPWTLASPCSCAFAGGGFGAKPSRPSSGTKKKKNRKGSWLVEELFTPSRDKHGGTKTANCVKPQLDKWGLPIPTMEDIFPPMPPGTELLPVNKEDCSLKEIKDAMKSHIRLKLDSFDEEGVERNAPPDRSPMKLRLLHQSPPVLAIDNFFTVDECLDVAHVAMPPKDKKVALSSSEDPVRVDSATFSPLAQSKRTSTSWFCHYSQVPILLSKAQYRLGIPLEQMEEPQIVRYKTGEEFSWHYDEVPPPQLNNGGQRLATLLVYLNSVQQGGGTVFRDLKDQNGNPLCMQPRQGSALIFFPAYADGRPDDRTLHKGKIAQDEKHIVQMWIHERAYQPVLPAGNSQTVAIPVIEQVSRELGYL